MRTAQVDVGKTPVRTAYAPAVPERAEEPADSDVAVATDRGGEDGKCILLFLPFIELYVRDFMNFMFGIKVRAQRTNVRSRSKGLGVLQAEDRPVS